MMCHARLVGESDADIASFVALMKPSIDGYNVVVPLLPPRQAFVVQRYAQYGYIALLLLLLLSYGGGNGPLEWLFGLASGVTGLLIGA